MIRFIIATCLLGIAQTHPLGMGWGDYNTDKCGYKSCPAPVPGKINVHLVPHTHDDVGWLKTVDQYYFGSRTNIQNAGVQYIIDSVVNELLHDPKKKFIYVETAFFWKWWREQEDNMKHRVKQLVKNGQLEFIGGAWSMNDEATTHYHSIIDQFTWGLRKLNDSFGYCGQPKIGWQIDPFGHSREMASMMAHFGFDGLFFGRLDFNDKSKRLETKTMEMIWEGHSTLGPKAELFTGALHNLYQAPRGFCFDILCGDEPIIDDRHSPDYNVERRVNEFIKYIYRQSNSYKTNNIMITMGGDFNYQDAHYYFKNLDKLVRYINKLGNNVNVFYSTPSCYVKSLNDANVTWPVKQDDFFPYASDPHAYWTGYFSSRPTLKYFERRANNLLQICKQLSALAHLGPEDNPGIDALREAMGIMQHHDAITGTEKQHVADDYARILTDGINKCGTVTKAGLNKIMTKGDPKIPPLIFAACPLVNISQCSISEQADKFLITIYNPLGRPVNHRVRLPVLGTKYLVKDPKGREVINQMVPIPEPLKKIPGRESKSTLELVFIAENIPPLGYRSYHISRLIKNGHPPKAENFESTDTIIIGNEKTKITLDRSSGIISSISYGPKQYSANQTIEYYISHTGNNIGFTQRASGAYIFRPKEQKTHMITVAPKLTCYKGPVVIEFHQEFSPWASQVLRSYWGEEGIAEIEWLVGPIPVGKEEGKEVVWKLKTNAATRGKFYTDSNGRQTIKRKRNFRPTWDLNVTEPVSGNYYPITTDVSIEDGPIEMSVLTDRAQGASSINDGELEIMLHRRILQDDGFGVEEALNERAFGEGLVARGQHWFLFSNKSDPKSLQYKRLKIQEKVLSSQFLLTDATSLEFEDIANDYVLEYSGLTKSLPPAVQILTLEPWKGRTYLLRLENIFDKNEAKEPVTVNLSDLFSAFEIVSIRETSLGADRWLNEVSRLKWKKETNEIVVDENKPKLDPTNLQQIILKPKEIRTFVCNIQPKGFN